MVHLKIMATAGLILARVNKGLRQHEVAKKAGITASAYGAIENKANGASPKTAFKISKALGVPVEQLFEISYTEKKRKENGDAE